MIDFTTVNKYRDLSSINQSITTEFISTNSVPYSSASTELEGNLISETNTVDLRLIPEIQENIICESDISSVENYWLSYNKIRCPNASSIVYTYVRKPLDRCQKFQSTSITSNILDYTKINNAIFSKLDDDPFGNRGVFHINHNIKVIFSKKIKFKSNDLKKKKPNITVDRRMLNAEDE